MILQKPPEGDVRNKMPVLAYRGRIIDINQRNLKGFKKECSSEAGKKR